MKTQDKITSLKHLEEVAHARKAVIVKGHPAWGRKGTPAAFMMNLSGAVLIRLFEYGMYIYEKEK